MLLLHAYALGSDLPAHLAKLAVAIHGAIATLKVSEGTIKELMTDFLFHLHEFVFGLEDVERLLSVVAKLQFLEQFGLLGFVLLGLNDLF